MAVHALHALSTLPRPPHLACCQLPVGETYYHVLQYREGDAMSLDLYSRVTGVTGVTRVTEATGVAGASMSQGSQE